MSAQDPRQKQPPNTPLPGLELMFAHGFPQNCTDPFAAFILAVHWSTVHTTHLRIPTTPPTESLPDNFPSLITNQDASSSYISLKYRNANTDKTINLKVQELMKDELAAVVVSEDEDKLDKPDKPKSAVKTFNIDEYVNCSAVRDGQRDVSVVYNVAKLWELEEIVKDELLKDEEDARKVDAHTPEKSPYSSNLTKSQQDRLEQERILRQIEEERAFANPNPLHDPLRITRPTHPFPRDIGRSDLDPFSGISPGGMGGMLMDPRGFRSPQLPGGVFPGARFDPIGPVGPFGPSRGGGGGFGMGGGRAPGVPFGMPNPDHERMPDGFDDMFM